MRYFITTLFYLTISAVSVLALGSKCSEALSASSASSDPYWLESMTHLGTAPYANSTNYQVFRNVRDYGAKGDGITDDTAVSKLLWTSCPRSDFRFLQAINAAISG
jgi:polygalacturonase